MKKTIITAIITAIIMGVIGFYGGYRYTILNQCIEVDADHNEVYVTLFDRVDVYDVDVPVKSGYHTLNEFIDAYKEVKRQKTTTIMNKLQAAFEEDGYTVYYDDRGTMHIDMPEK